MAADENVLDDGMTEEQELSFQIIASSGYARSLAFEALRKAKDGAFDEAHDLLEQAKTASIDGHNAQTSMITKEASGERVDVGIIVVHAQDHLMTSMLAQELIEEIVELREEIARSKSGN